MAVATPTYERQAGRRKLAKKKQALSDGSFPIPNTEYLGKAIRAVGRTSPEKRPALARLIRKRAHQLGPSGVAKLKGSWADPSKSKKEMARSLYDQLIELGTPADQALTETREYLTLELAMPVVGSGDGPRVTKLAGSGKPKKKTYDPDNDGDDDASPSGDTDKDYAGKLSPKARSVMKKLLARNMSPKAAYAAACRVDKKAM